MALCEGKPDVPWMQHHNGTFRSEDGGANWHEMNPPVSNFGFAVAAIWAMRTRRGSRLPIPTRGARRWDGRVVVNRTRDGWQEFRNHRRRSARRERL